MLRTFSTRERIQINVIVVLSRNLRLSFDALEVLNSAICCEFEPADVLVDFYFYIGTLKGRSISILELCSFSFH